MDISLPRFDGLTNGDNALTDSAIGEVSTDPQRSSPKNLREIEFLLDPPKTSKNGQNKPVFNNKMDFTSTNEPGLHENLRNEHIAHSLNNAVVVVGSNPQNLQAQNHRGIENLLLPPENPNTSFLAHATHMNMCIIAAHTHTVSMVGHVVMGDGAGDLVMDVPRYNYDLWGHMLELKKASFSTPVKRKVVVSSDDLSSSFKNLRIATFGPVDITEGLNDIKLNEPSDAPNTSAAMPGSLIKVGESQHGVRAQDSNRDPGMSLSTCFNGIIKDESASRVLAMDGKSVQVSGLSSAGTANTSNRVFPPKSHAYDGSSVRRWNAQL